MTRGEGLRALAQCNDTPVCHCEAQFKNVVAQFIGQLCLMNQATTKSGGDEAISERDSSFHSEQAPQSHAIMVQ